METFKLLNFYKFEVSVQKKLLLEKSLISNFDRETLEKTDWELSQLRITFGSLVCVMNRDFKF